MWIFPITETLFNELQFKNLLLTPWIVIHFFLYTDSQCTTTNETVVNIIINTPPTDDIL